MTVTTTDPLTISPGKYDFHGSSSLMTNSDRFRDRDGKGVVSLEKKDRFFDGAVTETDKDELLRDMTKALQWIIHRFVGRLRSRRRRPTFGRPRGA
jgi:hypothetical protein